MADFWDNIKSHSKIWMGFSLSLTAGLGSQSNAVKWLRLVFKAGPTALSRVPRKMVIVVCSDLSMSVGKIASQCALAAVGCFYKSYESHPKEVVPWLTQGQPKVVLKGGSGGDSSLMQLHHQAVQNSQVVSLIQDVGRTEVKKGISQLLGLDQLLFTR